METPNGATSPLTIKRYGSPNKHDQSPKGTICVVNNVNFPDETWEQTSEDSENPVWVMQDKS